jgi:hypothetical protein
MIASSARRWQVIDLQMCVQRADIADRSKQCALPKLIDRRLEAETNQATSFQNTHCRRRRSEAERFRMITARFHGGSQSATHARLASSVRATASVSSSHDAIEENRSANSTGTSTEADAEYRFLRNESQIACDGAQTAAAFWLRNVTKTRYLSAVSEKM